MKLTSAKANKLVKKLTTEKEHLVNLDTKSCTYIQVEGVDSSPMEYNFSESQGKIDEIDDKIARIKHGVNVMNTTTKLKDMDITIDEALVRMSQLNRKKERLQVMRDRLPKERRVQMMYGVSNNFVEYECANYDIRDACAEYEKVDDMITDLQLQIDYANQTAEFDLDI